MARDATLAARRACLIALKGDADVVSMVPAASILPGTTPTVASWPFIRWGSPAAVPVRGACVDGASVSITFHAFAHPREEAGLVVETAEDFAARIGGAVAAALDRQRLPLDGGGALHVLWRGSQLMRDGDDEQAWHSVQMFAGRMLG